MGAMCSYRFAVLPLALGGLLAGLSAPAAIVYPDDSLNFISNGSFESPVLEDGANPFQGGLWQIVNPDGWTGDPLTAEIMRGPMSGLGTAAHGDQWVELRPFDATTIYQDIHLNAGSYLLSFYARARAGTTADENGMWYFVSDLSNSTDFFYEPSAPWVLASGVVDGSSLFTDEWQRMTSRFEVETAGSFRVQIGAYPDTLSSSTGGFLDAVSVTVVPVPPAAAIGLIGLAMVAGQRFRKPRARK